VEPSGSQLETNLSRLAEQPGRDNHEAFWCKESGLIEVILKRAIEQSR
jgi:hypothetical protein